MQSPQGLQRKVCKIKSSSVAVKLSWSSAFTHGASCSMPREPITFLLGGKRKGMYIWVSSVCRENLFFICMIKRPTTCRKPDGAVPLYPWSQCARCGCRGKGEPGSGAGTFHWADFTVVQVWVSMEDVLDLEACLLDSRPQGLSCFVLLPKALYWPTSFKWHKLKYQWVGSPYKTDLVRHTNFSVYFLSEFWN